MTDGTGDARLLYKINEPGVVAQVVEGEALLIAFETGKYYSSADAGGLIIEAIQQGASLTRIVAAFSRAGSSAEAIQSGVVAFVEQLVTEQLIVPSQAQPTSDWAPASMLTFRTPVLHTYTDLEDLLVLDPIHDVDAAGWPVARVPA